MIYLSLTLTLDGLGGQRDAPAALTPEKGPGTHCTGDWVGPRAGLEGVKYLAPTTIRRPDLQQVASRYTGYPMPPPLFN